MERKINWKSWDTSTSSQVLLSRLVTTYCKKLAVKTLLWLSEYDHYKVRGRHISVNLKSLFPKITLNFTEVLKWLKHYELDLYWYNKVKMS